LRLFASLKVRTNFFFKAHTRLLSFTTHAIFRTRLSCDLDHTGRRDLVKLPVFSNLTNIFALSVRLSQSRRQTNNQLRACISERAQLLTKFACVLQARHSSRYDLHRNSCTRPNIRSTFTGPKIVLTNCCTTSTLYERAS
jgi:hypothetical protein